MSDAIGRISADKLRLLRRRRGEEFAPAVPPAASDQGPGEASPLQHGFWFLDQTLGPGDNSVYNLYSAVRLRGVLGHERLAAALNHVVSRHEPLRSVFRPGVGRTPRVAIERFEIALPVHDLRGLTADHRVIAARRVLEARARAPFSLDEGPLLRTELARIGETDHILMISAHHIVFDWWSSRVFLRELADGYAGVPPQPLPLRYADVAAWQRAPQRREIMERQLLFWRERLTGAPEYLDLPHDVTTRTPAHAGADLRFPIAEDIAVAAKALARETKTTLFAVLLAAFQVHLSRYAGQPRIAVGTPVAGRSAPGFDQLIGLFVNTVVLQSDISDRPTFRELVSRTHGTFTTALEHQDVPFEQVVQRVRPMRHPDRNPLYQVMFTLRQTEGDIPDFAGLSATAFRLDSDTAKLDLTLDIEDRGDGLHCTLNHRLAVFPAQTAAAYASSLRTALGALLAHADRRVDECAMLDTTDLAQVARWNDTRHMVPATTVDRMVAAAGSAAPDATALVHGDVVLSYRDLDRRAATLAQRLIEFGAGAERIVAVRVPRSIELVIALLAVLRTGAAYLPIDPAYPPDRAALLIEDARPIAVIGSGDVTAPPFDAVGPSSAARPDGGAYVLYTSGSTGRPKGVVVEHRSMVNRLCWMQHEYRLRPGERVLHKTPASFDVSVWEIFWPLTVGATVVLADPDGHRDPGYIAKIIREQHISVVHFVPSMLSAFLREPAAARCTGLRLVLCSGEALSPELRAEFHSTLDVALHNLYGPTEATIDVSRWECPPDPAPTPVPIGRPVWNTALYVLDARLRPLPAGAPGELYIGGAQVARGYLHRPALTARAFLPDPFAAEGRMYRTGDRARWNPDGTVEYLGRVDDQIKLRGFRIEPGEIRAALTALPGVDSAAVVLREDTPGERRLVGYAVAEPGVTLNGDALRTALIRRLPEHLVPTTVIVLLELPVTENGKLDRRALPPPVTRVAGDGRHGNAREQALCEYVAAVLGVPHVGPNDDFFELGGDSIESAQLVGRAARAGLYFTTRDVFHARTPAGLAAIATEQVGALDLPDVAGSRADLTPIMHWWLERGGPIAGYHQAVLVRTPQGADLDRMTAVLQAVLDRHDMLRARLGDDKFEIHPPGVVRAESCLRRVTARVDPDSLSDAEDEARTRLNPAEGRMLDATWFAEPVDRLLLVVHHLAVDGVSWRVLTADLAHAWSEVLAGRAPVLPEPGVSFAQWSALLRRDAHDRFGELCRWREVLATSGRVPAATRPLDREADTVATLRSRSAELDPEYAGPLLTELHGLVGGTVDDVLLTVLALAIQRWTGSTAPIRVHVERHGREEIAAGVDLSSTVGWHTIVVPVRLDTGGLDAVGTAIKRVKEQLRATSDRGIGYGQLRYLTAAGGELFDGVEEPAICFNYLGRFSTDSAKDWAQAPESPAIRVGADPDMPVAHQLELVAVAEPCRRGLRLRITATWPGGVFAPEAVERFLRDWSDAAMALAAYADEPGAGGVSPSDVAVVGMAQDEIDEFEAALNRGGY